MAIIFKDKNIELPKRRAFDYYPTPFSLCYSAVKNILSERFFPEFILDPGAGSGVWGEALRYFYFDSIILGVELRDVEKPPHYDYWVNNTDYLTYKLSSKPDLIIGNPPYKIGEQFVDKSLALLEDNGYLLFLLKLTLLESIGRYNKYYNNGLNPKEVWVSTRRVDFYKNMEDQPKGSGNADAFALYLWQKNWTGETTLKWLDWKYNDE